MIDLNKEREVFDKEFGVADFNMFTSNDENLEQSMVLKCNWLGWKACAESKQSEIDELKAKLEVAQVPEGFVLVPKEPTEEIINAMHDSFLGAFIEGKATGGQSIEFAYKAMIEAAQGDGHDEILHMPRLRGINYI